MVEATVVANRRTVIMAPFFVACVIAIVVAGAGCGREAKVVAPPALEVSVSQPVEEPVQDALEFTGRTSAVDSVEVRARVTGYITKVAFTDGALVNVGDLLREHEQKNIAQAASTGTEHDRGWWRWRWWRPQW